MGDLEASDMQLRRAARERALELLYESEVKALDVETLLEGLPIPPADLALELVRGVEAHHARIDELIDRRVKPSWSLDRLAAVDRAILRLATYELLAVPERSQAIILNEAVVLARRFGSDESPRFINGVLSAIAAEVRPGAGADAAPEVEPAVDALVMDFDGVIRHWDTELLREAERALEVPAGSIVEAAFESDRFDRAMRGVLSAEEWYAETGAVVAHEHHVDASAVATAFSQVGWRIDEVVVDLVRQAHRMVPVALLSNASSRLVDDVRRSGILDCFDVVLSSADVGACKPEPVVFTTAAERLGVAVARCLLVDDRAENVAAAAALGMWAVHFTQVDDLAHNLDLAGLLDLSLR
jgi:putative hydrolase of the HAD superfamily